MVLCVTAPDALAPVAAGLRVGVRAGDLAYRLDDGELAAVLAETEADTGLAVAARLDGADPSFTVGTAAFPDDGDDPEDLLEVARARALKDA
jgi:GGDEF domain-containing protein